LGATFDPVLDALVIKRDFARLAAGVIVPDDFNESPVTFAPLFRHDHAVKGPFLGSHAS
jgi:hypothetical protein